MSDARPPHFPPGTPIGKHYTVEGLVRLSEGRMFYLVNDDRPDQPTRRCWSCGEMGTRRGQPACGACGAPFHHRRFLLSSRWHGERYSSYEAYGALRLSHPGVSAPVDVFRHESQLLSVVPYRGERLMVDEAAPFSNQRVLDVAQRVAGTLAFLCANGVRLRQLDRANLLIAPDNSLQLFDLEVEEVRDEPLPLEEVAAALADLARLLRSFCHIDSADLDRLFREVEGGHFPTVVDFGREIERCFDSLASIAYAVDSGAMSDVGLSRQLNEDSWGWRRLGPDTRLYVVADGMGGHDGGEVASRLAVDTICRVAEVRSRDGVDRVSAERTLDESFQTANNTVKEHAEERGNDMGTTLVAMLVHQAHQGFIANVGDSRAYLLRQRSLHQVTTDHSLVQKMVERGRITAEEARHHPHANILLRTVGTERDVDIDIFRVQLASGDRVLMCSDGLWGEVDDRDMENILNTYSDPRVAARELVRASHHGGGKDNVTLLLIDIP